MDAIRKTRSRRPCLLTLVVSLSFALAALTDARGLDPSKAIPQYIQTTWNSEAGLPQNSVLAITQTKDGFIWMENRDAFALDQPLVERVGT